MNVSGMFARGSTYYGPSQTVPSDYGNSQGLEGHVADFPDLTPGTVPPTKRSDRFQRCILVRNVSGLTLTAKRMVTWKAGYRGRRIDGYARTTAVEVAGVVDEHMGAQGVRDGDLFWLAIGGPCLVKTPLEGDANNVITEGDVMVALTGVTSGATTAGRPVSMSVATTGTTTVILQLLNQIGRAMSAKTTANTNADVLIDLALMKGSMAGG